MRHGSDLCAPGDAMPDTILMRTLGDSGEVVESMFGFDTAAKTICGGLWALPVKCPMAI